MLLGGSKKEGLTSNTCFASTVRVLAALERAGVHLTLPVREEDEALAGLVQCDYSAVCVH